MLNEAYHELVSCFSCRRLAFLTYQVNQSNGLRGLVKYLDIFSHRHPKMKLLEIGGGAGAVTELLVETLVDRSDPRCGHLDYTDASPDKVAKAQTKFVEANGMGFKVLEISKDPQAQGFECGTYDMVVASFHLLTCLAGLPWHFHSQDYIAECTQAPQAVSHELLPKLIFFHDT